MNLKRLSFRCVIAALLVLCPAVWAVDCIPDTITLTSQAEVDNFQATHGPGCDTVVSGLTIDGVSISDLTPLAALTTVSSTGPFTFDSRFTISNTSLTTLAGLENLANVFRLELTNNSSLASLAALSNLVTVRGPLFINGNGALTNLAGLENLTALPGGALFIENNPMLTDLGGVSNISSINASLLISNNDALVNLDAFSGLTQVSSNISILGNDSLQNIEGLGGLNGFTAGLNIRSNNQLTSLGNLGNLSQLGGLIIWRNPLLTNLNGLDNLTHLGDQTALSLHDNDTLNNIQGLANVISAEFDVEITDNPMLDDCSPLLKLLDSVDDGDPGPGPGDAGIPDVGGDVILANNLPGCNAIPQPPEGSLVYGAFANGRPHLLFKGVTITRNCFGPLQPISTRDFAPDNRLQFACSAISYADTETLVYDVAANRCQVLQDFESDTDLQTAAVYLDNENLGATLQQQSDAIFDVNPNALLLFDPQNGELTQGEPLVCAQPGRSDLLFRNGFE